jgi:hypothetical protein
VVASAEMHTAKAVAPASAMTSAEMTSAEMSATAVTATAVTTAASRQRRTRQQARDNQNGNSNAELWHVICSGLIACSNDVGKNRKFPAPKSAPGQTRRFRDAPEESGAPPITDIRCLAAFLGAAAFAQGVLQGLSSDDPIRFGPFPSRGSGRLLLMPMQRSHHRDMRHHRIAAVLAN